MAVGDTNRYLFKVTDNNKIVEQAEGELVHTILWMNQQRTMLIFFALKILFCGK